MTAPRKGLTVGQPEQDQSGFGPYDEYGREAGPPWTPPNAGDPHGYTDTIPSDETQGARYGISVARPQAGASTAIVPGAPELIQSVHARTGALRQRRPTVERSPDGVRPAIATSDFRAGLGDTDGDGDGD